MTDLFSDLADAVQAAAGAERDALELLRGAVA
jgi:hypothetical protein